MAASLSQRTIDGAVKNIIRSANQCKRNAYFSLTYSHSPFICLFRIRKLLKSRTKWKRKVIVCQWVDLLNFIFVLWSFRLFFSVLLHVLGGSIPMCWVFTIDFRTNTMENLSWFLRPDYIDLKWQLGFFLLCFLSVLFCWIGSCSFSQSTSPTWRRVIMTTCSHYWSALSSFCVKNISYLHNFGLNHIEFCVNTNRLKLVTCNGTKKNGLELVEGLYHKV